MKINIINGNIDKDEILYRAGSYASICYSDKGYDDLSNDKDKCIKIANHCIKSGHHSILDHIWITLEITNIPKIIAMKLNNIGFYNTSEKSARYVDFGDKYPLYSKWKEIFKELILNSENVKPHIKDDIKLVQKLALENARYMLPIDLPTNMIYSISIRQLAYMYNVLDDLILKYENNLTNENYNNEFDNIVISGLKDLKEAFNESFKDLIENNTILNITRKGDSIMINKMYFGTYEVNEEESICHYDDSVVGIYRNIYEGSISMLGQLQRHRTLDIYIENSTRTGELKYYVPPIITDMNKTDEYINDLKNAQYIPLSTIVKFIEIGTINAHESKALDRLCSRSQYEIMENIRDNYLFLNNDKPRCAFTKCKEPCKYGLKGLDRII